MNLLWKNFGQGRRQTKYLLTARSRIPCPHTHKMEIYCEVKNFSFYENSSTFYITCRVLEKQISPGCHPFKEQFEGVEIGETIQLKVEKKKLEKEQKISPERLVLLLLSPFLIFELDTWEPASTNPLHKNSSPKFGLSNARTCAIFPGK